MILVKFRQTVVLDTFGSGYGGIKHTETTYGTGVQVSTNSEVTQEPLGSGGSSTCVVPEAPVIRRLRAPVSINGTFLGGQLQVLPCTIYLGNREQISE